MNKKEVRAESVQMSTVKFRPGIEFQRYVAGKMELELSVSYTHLDVYKRQGQQQRGYHFFTGVYGGVYSGIVHGRDFRYVLYPPEQCTAPSRPVFSRPPTPLPRVFS